MRQHCIAKILAMILLVACCACRTVPAEFEFLYEGGIENPRAAWAALPYDSITLERSNCMLPCPAYKVTLHRGRPTTQGRQTNEDIFGPAELHATVPSENWSVNARLFPEKSGDFTGRVAIGTYARLCYLLSTTHFSNMSDRYAATWTDDRTVVVTATANGKTKVVSEYGGVGPSELWGIQQAIDSIAQRLVWTPN